MFDDAHVSDLGFSPAVIKGNMSSSEPGRLYDYIWIYFNLVSKFAVDFKKRTAMHSAFVAAFERDP